MKRNLNVFTYGIYKTRHIRVFFSNIKQVFINIKYAFQRATRGYCDCDTWDLDAFYTDLFIESLKHFIEYSDCYPDEFGSFENWQAEINKMIDLFEHSREDAFKNEFEDAWRETFKSNGDLDECLEKINHPNNEQEELRKKFFAKEKENYEQAEKNKNEAMDMLKKYFYNLWW